MQRAVRFLPPLFASFRRALAAAALLPTVASPEIEDGRAVGTASVDATRSNRFLSLSLQFLRARQGRSCLAVTEGELNAGCRRGAAVEELLHARALRSRKAGISGNSSGSNEPGSGSSSPVMSATVATSATTLFLLSKMWRLLPLFPSPRAGAGRYRFH